MHMLMLTMAAMASSAVASADVRSAATTGAAAAAEDNRIYCRKRVETGSLVRQIKQCFTKAEWDKIAESQQRSYLRLRDNGAGQ